MNPERKQVDRDISRAEVGFGEPGPYATDWIAWIQSKVELAPAEYRESAQVWIEADYDGVARFCVSYTSPETDEELATRLAREAKVRLSRQERLAREKAQAQNIEAAWLLHIQGALKE